jgi:hypothetical protein
VLSVHDPGGGFHLGDWTFDQPVTIAGNPIQCKVAGNTPLSPGTQQAAAIIRLQYGVSPTGNPWTLNSAETHITPQPAFPQSGTGT